MRNGGWLGAMTVAMAVTVWLGACGDSASDGAAGGGGGEPDAGTDAGGRAGQPGNAEQIAPEPMGEGCDAPSVTLGQSATLELEHDGELRSYILYAPAGIDPAAPTPLVLNFHGLTSNAAQQQLYAGNAIADERGHVVAYPQGLGNSFNAGPCCSALGNPAHMADDVGFAKAVIADVASRLCVDRRRVYSTGMSNGGYMSEHNACEAADVYAAVAPVSAMAFARPACAPSRPIPMVAFNGTADSLVSYTSVSETSWPAWVERQGCEGEPRRDMYGAAYCDVYTRCGDGIELSLCTIPDMGHCWPGNPLALPGLCPNGGGTDLVANTMMYDFFARFALPD